VWDWIFGNATARERQRSVQYARDMLATWERHVEGDPPEDAVTMREAAQHVVGWYGEASQHSRIARRVLAELER